MQVAKDKSSENAEAETMQALSKQGIVYASHAFAGQGILVMLAFHCMGRLFFVLQLSTLSERELYSAYLY